MILLHVIICNIYCNIDLQSMSTNASVRYDVNALMGASNIVFGQRSLNFARASRIICLYPQLL